MIVSNDGPVIFVMLYTGPSRWILDPEEVWIHHNLVPQHPCQCLCAWGPGAQVDWPWEPDLDPLLTMWQRRHPDVCCNLNNLDADPC